MSFSVDDYEKAIARIFDQQGHVIGTGFLVAPGYVLTCAHVVLQAIGIAKEKFAEYEGQPQAQIAQTQITLDFHVLASGQPIKAEVVAWLPYSIDSGDVAALKLQTPEPDGAMPIPLVEVARVAVENDPHSVYGFGKSSSGGRSDAYRPKANVAGGRFQLCKSGNPDDETIKPGFSGAPVWNEARQCVIGMVATAVVTKDEQQSTAYAIPTQELKSILKQIEAFSLFDVFSQSLAACSSDDERQQLNTAIVAALQRCNPNGSDRPWRDQLLDLSIDRAPAYGWETEGRLSQLAVMLAWMGDTPSHAYDRLKAWVERCNLSFPDLLDRLTREMKQQKVSSNNSCQHLMVEVEQVEASPNELCVSLWPVPDRETYDPNNPPMPIVSKKTLPIAEFPAFIREQIRRKLRKHPTPTIHLFVPRALFGCDVEMLPSSKLGTVLGSEYPFVVRTNLKTHPIGSYYYDDWLEKWEQLEEAFEHNTINVFQAVDCSVPEQELIAELATATAALLKKCDAVDELFELIAEETALPVALWSRNSEFQDQLTDVLDCLVEHLPHRIQEERSSACKAKVKSLLGHHLSLVWEDPKILPPDMQFDPEAC